MIKPEVLDAMVESGCTAEQIAAVVKASMGNASSNAERQARWRERNRSSHVTQDNVTPVTDNDDPLPPKEKSPTPPKEITPITETTKRARRLSDDWVLPASWGRWAVGEGYSEAIIRLQADQFADFWKAKAGKDAAKLDWEATWRNWMRKVPKVSRNFGTPAPKPKSEFMQHQDDVQRELDKVLGRKRDDEFTGNTLDLETGNWRAH
ncbi:hypothetical protein [Rhizobium laguerreae]|uniref:Uncharacterized protein n=1 Tax=Rhizobium laguerreae TaxID=1076926 RepID=A0A7Y2RBJ3_9HYPH|nr:hypothetical protein [Rhizobium laguerreae]NNH67808.1 hypothetical protein [Rhizobium laguerreae]